jgi:hypothetical protein
MGIGRAVSAIGRYDPKLGACGFVKFCVMDITWGSFFDATSGALHGICRATSTRSAADGLERRLRELATPALPSPKRLRGRRTGSAPASANRESAEHFRRAPLALHEGQPETIDRWHTETGL